MIIPALVGGLLVLLMLVGNQLYSLLRYLYNGVPLRDVATALCYYIPGVSMLAIPAAVLLGTALSLNRLVRDREILALCMAGVKLKRIVLPIILLGIFASGVMFYLQESVIPQTQHKAIQLTQKLALGSTAAVVPRDVVFKAGDYFIYIRSVDDTPQQQLLRGVMIVKINSNSYPTWFTIPVAENHNGTITFQPDPVNHEPPRSYTFPLTGNVVTSMEATGGTLKLPENAFDYLYTQPTTPEELTLKQLLALRHGVRGAAGYGMSNGVMLDTPHLNFYINRKIAAPLAALVAILIAIPLSVHFGRSGGYVGLLLSVVVAFCFIVTQQWTQVLAETNRLQPILAAWAPDAIYGILGIILLIREE